MSTPPDRPEQAGYPGAALVLLAAAAAVVAVRRRRRDIAAPRWRSIAVGTLATISVVMVLAGIAEWLTALDVVTIGPWSVSTRHPYKPVGIGIDLAILAILISPRFTALVRFGSAAGLYVTGVVVAAMLSLGPTPRAFGHRFWYKAPFTWLLDLPGFESSRVPALFASVEMLCLAVVAAFAIVRLWPRPTRVSLIATVAIAALVVVDGWASVPAVRVPGPIPVPLHADLVVELPTRGWVEDAAAMYRGTLHGRAVVNGYSGFFPPHYGPLHVELRGECVASLETVRGGRSIDAVIWRADGSAPAVDDGLRRLWPNAVREETPEVIVYRHPRTPSKAEIDDKCP